MKVKEVLVEYKIHKIEDIIVFQNPNKEQFLNVLVKDGGIRGIVIEKDIYIWHAYDAVHMTIMAAFENQGLRTNDMYPFIITPSDIPRFDIELDDMNNKNISSLRAFRRMTRNLKISEWN